MIIKFDDIEEKAIPNFQGGNGVFNAKITNDGKNKILMGRLSKGDSIGLHTHTGTSEIIYIIKGKGLMVCDDEEEVLTAGMVHYCPMNSEHEFTNLYDEEVEFFAVVPNHKVD